MPVRHQLTAHVLYIDGLVHHNERTGGTTVSHQAIQLYKPA